MGQEAFRPSSPQSAGAQVPLTMQEEGRNRQFDGCARGGVATTRVAFADRSLEEFAQRMDQGLEEADWPTRREII
jgi:hypothetical protein